MKIKKIFNLLLVFLLTAGLLTGCTGKQDSTVTLESIAKLNNIETDSLNVVYDDNGYLTFLSGGKFADVKITTKEEAETFLEEKMSDLLSLDGVNIEYSDVYKSPNTNVTYYRFEQTLNGDLYGLEDIALKYLVNTVKLGVDQDGYPIVLSSDLDHSEYDYSGEDIITMEEAAEKVKAAYPDITVYDDYTGLGIWNDNSSRQVSTDTKACLCYMVYGDNPNFGTDEDCSPYMAYIVRAEKNDGDSILTCLATYDLGEYSRVVESTTTKFFEDKKDVGTYTYTVDFDWMNETDLSYSEAFAGKDNMEVTVPVMYCESEGLYYLGEVEHNISMSNYYDFVFSAGDINKVNPYVTDNPDDLSSWHFKKTGNSSSNIEAYFDDPDYVMASFAEYYKTVELFGTKFDLFNQYPDDSYLLLTYSLYGSITYPETAAGFMLNNACNGGIMYNWNIFMTSPCGAVCLDDMVMGHEFTHGVNSHFTDTICRNEQGAVMEAVADMVGYHVAASLDESYDSWMVGGNYSSVLRCLYDPNLMGSPKYINGLYYVSPIDNALVSDLYLDFGGVHLNNCIPDYLGFSFVNGETAEGEENITLAEGADLWFEAVCLTNYDTDFKNLGAYLKYAVKQLNYSEDKQTYVTNTIKRYGFEDGTVDSSLLTEDDAETLNISYQFEEGLDAQDYSKGIHIYLSSGGSVFVTSSELSEDIMIPDGQSVLAEYITVLDNDTGTKYSAWTRPGYDFDKPIVNTVKKVELAEGETFEIGDDETPISFSTATYLPDTNTITYEDVGRMILTSSATDSNAVSLYMVYEK